MPVEVRRYQTSVEEILHEGGPPPEQPLLVGSVAAVIENPFAGRYVEELQPFMDELKPLGLAMAERLVAALGGDAARVEGYGKATIVGAGGELEHGALWHVPGGYAMRELLGGAMAIVPSSKKVADVGARIDVPITHIDASYVRGHFNAIEVGLPDAPRPEELVLILVMTTGGRIHDRMGGLRKEDVKGEDGLR
ncbi:amino acid synthesis family protein [Pelagibius sp.]|uniref:amino acid synthesis family protein n=1 Tax=Pelagibius sp. TaxID=1931238 RepID=UPI002603965C|nr:amino acid synthesis family protein [Pelagibius sp.]